MPISLRSLAPIVLLALSATGRSEIRYEVGHDPIPDRLTVVMRFQPRDAKTILQMPSWSPGLYVREDYWKWIGDLAATDESGGLFLKRRYRRV